MTRIAHAKIANASITNAMTVDIEDWFQVQAFAATIARDDWDQKTRRVEQNTDWLLDLFAENHVKITFFTLGWVAARHPALIRRIVAEGHELASHGFAHHLAHDQSPAQFREDVTRAKAVLEDLGGVAVRGYRDHPIEGHDFVEIPMTALRAWGRNWPVAGGGYFRLMPYVVYRAAIRHLNNVSHMPALFYTHPWEIDPEQPRNDAASKMAKFRHYLNLHQMKGRMALLLRDFAWGRVDQVFADAFSDSGSGLA
jgi:peptidoglycan/xylan/chitin deacetylase (PgdA/CDA1 family)